MTKRVREFGRPHPRLPKSRVAGDGAVQGYFYAGEATRILRLEDIDYQQVRRLFRFVREQAGVPLTSEDGRRWARFTVADLACMESLIELCGGRDALARGRRLRIRPIRLACEWLRTQGIDNPLLQVPMIRIGDQVFAVIDGAVVQARSSQLVIEGMIEVVGAHLGTELEVDDDLRAAIDVERRRASRIGQQSAHGLTERRSGSTRVYRVPPQNH
ncbi:MAG: hypothetical protein R2734_18345 [Nocardioides sp.]